MERITQYLRSLVIASLICSVLKTLVGSKSTNGKVVSLVCAAFIMITVITPWVNFQIPSIEIITSSFDSEAENITQYGKDLADKEYRSIIKSTTESYILEKASSLNTEIEVDVRLNKDNAIPESISIRGDVSPYAKQTLTNYLKETFAISEDQQEWNQIS